MLKKGEDKGGELTLDGDGDDSHGRGGDGSEGDEGGGELHDDSFRVGKGVEGM